MKLRAHVHHQMLALISIVLAPALAHAKIVKLRWSEVPRAAGYELEIRNGQGNANPKLVKIIGTQWKGELGNGAYVYRVRAIDRVKRPGAWSGGTPLVVTASAPKPVTPEPRRKIGYYEKRPELKLAWKPVPGIAKYRVELFSGDKTIHNSVVAAPEITIPDVPDGNYSYRVSSIVEFPNDPAFSKIGMEHWQSPTSDGVPFEITKLALQRPEPQFPLGRQEIPTEGALSFRWDPTEGATRYEIVLEEARPRSSGRSPASAEPAPIHRTVVDAKTHSVQIPTPKKARAYRWRVRAFAGEEPGPESVAEFELDHPLNLFARSGQIRLAPSLYPFDFTTANGPAGKRGTLGSSGLMTSLGGTYWAGERWGFSASLDHQMVGLPTTLLTRMGASAQLSGRLSLHRWVRNWTTQLHVGGAYQQYFDLVPIQNTPIELSAFGPSFRAELTGPLTGGLGLNLRASLFVPTSVSGDESVGSRALSLGGELTYAWRPDLRIGAGIQRDQVLLNYGAGFPAKQIELAGTRMQLVLVYQFGQSADSAAPSRKPAKRDLEELDQKVYENFKLE